jgi:glycosyltransferase involved in cell wall biosynthesis
VHGKKPAWIDIMTDSHPLVSICIPTYNRASMVHEAIQSAIDQSYENLEILVVDNASSDNIKEVVESFQDSRLRLVVNEKNLGLFGNFNRCIELGKGKYIHILHSDDAIDSRFTQTCVEFLESSPSVAMTFTAAEVISGATTKSLKISDNNLIFAAPEGFRKILLTRNFIVCPSVMVRREVYEQVGSFSLEYPFSSDYYQWLKIARLYDIAYIADTRVFYRQGEHSESFRLQFTSPSGYLDTEKIYLQVLLDLGDERKRFASELKMAFRVFINDCLFAGFTRSDSMKAGSAALFWGIALGVWGLLQPQSVADSIRKAWYLLVIQVTGFLMQFSWIRAVVRKILYRKTVLY